MVVQKKIGRERERERERGYQYYQVVKSLRNWARAQERKAVRRGRLEGIMDGSDLTLEDASAAVITSSISNQKKKKKPIFYYYCRLLCLFVFMGTFSFEVFVGLSKIFSQYLASH